MVEGSLTLGSSGLGYATAQHLAAGHADKLIVITGRSPRGAADAINKATGHDNVRFLPVDLSSEAGSRDFAKRFLEAEYPPLEVLIINAALQYLDGVHTTVDGIEESFAVNHLNQALIFFLLKHRLTDTARIVIVGSTTHDPDAKRIPLAAIWTTAEQVARPEQRKEKDSRNEGFRRYGLSKAANVMFMLALANQAREQGKHWTVMGLEPGVMATNLYRSLGPVLHTVFGWVLKSPLRSLVAADTYPAELVGKGLARLAADPEYTGQKVHAKYLDKDGDEFKMSTAALDKANQADLWNWTIHELAGGAEEEGRFGAL